MKTTKVEFIEINPNSNTNMKIILHVKDEIFQSFPKFASFNIAEMLVVPWQEFLHNDRGPAYISEGIYQGINVANVKEYCINGEILDPVEDKEKIEKIEHSREFSNSVEEFLNE